MPHQTETGIAYQHLRFVNTAEEGILGPEDLKNLKLPDSVQYTQGIVIEGRGPIWLYGYLVHECHPAAWVGCYDPRLGGAVIVATHTKGFPAGSLLKLTPPT